MLLHLCFWKHLFLFILAVLILLSTCLRICLTLIYKIGHRFVSNTVTSDFVVIVWIIRLALRAYGAATAHEKLGWFVLGSRGTILLVSVIELSRGFHIHIAATVLTVLRLLALQQQRMWTDLLWRFKHIQVHIVVGAYGTLMHLDRKVTDWVYV